jgi:Trk K+ transport system NAD-binding subunit
LITLVTRGREVVAPTGHTRLLGWDQVTVLARAEDEEEVRAALLQPFERPVEPEEPTTRVLDVEPTLSPRAADAGPRKTILLGHGRVGAVLADFLRRRRLPFIVIEQDLTTVDGLRRAGVPVIHGEGGKPAVLESAGIADARLLLITSAEPVTVRRAVEYARQVNPAIEIVIRVHQPAEFNQLSAIPQTQCIYGEMEIAYAMARLMLLASGVSVIEAEAILMDARRDQSGPGIPRTRITEIHVPATSPAIGKKLSELGLPRGTLLITISRNDEFVVPNGQTEILADDALLVLADTEAARRIEQLILPAPADAS